MKVEKRTEADNEDKPKREIVPEGEYDIFVGNVEVKNVGAVEEWKIQTEIEKGPFKGRWLFDTITWEEKWRWKYLMILEAVGIDTDEDQQVTTNDLIGKQATVKVKHTVKGDKTYANIRGWEGYPF